MMIRLTPGKYGIILSLSNLLVFSVLLYLRDFVILFWRGYMLINPKLLRRGGGGGGKLTPVRNL